MIVRGNALHLPLADASVHACITSPPFFNLRSYQGIEPMPWPSITYAPMPGLPPCVEVPAMTCCLGNEDRLDAYIGHLLLVFREVRRVLRSDGTVWGNWGDVYAAGKQGRSDHGKQDPTVGLSGNTSGAVNVGYAIQRRPPAGLKPKDLCMVPARMALALQADGWWVRSMVPWIKTASMPESVEDRPGSAVEYIFLLAKSGDAQFWMHPTFGGVRTNPAPDYRWIDHANDDAQTDLEPIDWRTETMPGPDGKPMKRWRRVNLWEGRAYYYDPEAVKVPFMSSTLQDARFGNEVLTAKRRERNRGGRSDGYTTASGACLGTPASSGRNRRNSDWFLDSLRGLVGNESGEPLALLVNPKGFAEAHFACWPEALVEPMVKASTSEHGVCPACKAPWVQQVERETYREKYGEREMPKTPFNVPRAGWRKGAPQANTTGWVPSCACNAGLPEPAVVLDPFAGSGTTCRVARQLGRQTIGIELSPEYAAMAKRREETYYRKESALKVRDGGGNPSLFDVP